MTDYSKIEQEVDTEKAMKQAKKPGLTVVSMKQDWKQVFSFQGKS